MLTLDAMNAKLDALTAGMNSVTAAQSREWEKILDFEKHCADAFRLLESRLSGQISGVGAGLADELSDTRKQILLLISILHDAKPRKAKRRSKKR